jgi:ABC-2 type transport system permease protein
LVIVLSKYIAAVCIYILALSGTLVMALILNHYSSPDWAVIFGNFFGLLLLGSALIAVCLFISSLTENQIIAAVGGFAVSLFLILMDAIVYVVNNNALQTIFRHMSFNNRYMGFTIGIIGFVDVIFFISIAAFFLSLTILVLERRRHM